MADIFRNWRLKVKESIEEFVHKINEPSRTVMLNCIFLLRFFKSEQITKLTKIRQRILSVFKDIILTLIKSLTKHEKEEFNQEYLDFFDSLKKELCS